MLKIEKLKSEKLIIEKFNIINIPDFIQWKFRFTYRHNRYLILEIE